MRQLGSSSLNCDVEMTLGCCPCLTVKGSDQNPLGPFAEIANLVQSIVPALDLAKIEAKPSAFAEASGPTVTSCCPLRSPSSWITVAMSDFPVPDSPTI